MAARAFDNSSKNASNPHWHEAGSLESSNSFSLGSTSDDRVDTEGSSTTCLIKRDASFSTTIRGYDSERYPKRTPHDLKKKLQSKSDGMAGQSLTQYCFVHSIRSAGWVLKSFSMWSEFIRCMIRRSTQLGRSLSRFKSNYSLSNRTPATSRTMSSNEKNTPFIPPALASSPRLSPR